MAGSEKTEEPYLLTAQKETSTVLQMWLDRCKGVLTSCCKIKIALLSPNWNDI